MYLKMDQWAMIKIAKLPVKSRVGKKYWLPTVRFN